MEAFAAKLPLSMEDFMTPELLKQIIADQQEEELVAPFVSRRDEKKLNQLASNKEIIVITGVRRCGKSALLQYIRKQNKQKDYYFNFEDERLVTFTVSHFQMLQEVFVELFGNQKTYYFDEIQNIENWELFVRRLYNAGNKIYITGSNATLFSDELGTRLTGRYISCRIYPFSFSEFAGFQVPELFGKKVLSTTQTGEMLNVFNQYCQRGGFPAYVKYGQAEYLHSLYESIIYRDIIARYKITNAKPIKEMVFYLASNCSKEMSYSAIKNNLGIGSVTTVSDYCSYLENSFLCFFVNRYSESVKAQMLSPKKAYFIDHEFARTIGFRFSEDRGRMLENMVFLELKRRDYDVFYHKQNKECDFLIRKNGLLEGAIQVCQSLQNEKTKQREIEGLLDALERHSFQQGMILTEREEGSMDVQHKGVSYKIEIKPIWKWLLQW
jgi:predicted AAA+ superfamily ATPase